MKELLAENSCDIVIVGGGVAGSTAAALLSQYGFSTIVLEKGRHPRKVVGESILPHMWGFADLLGITKEIDEANFIVKRGGISYWDGKFRELFFKDFGYNKPGINVDRDIFDHILINNARKKGARVYEETTANSITQIADLEVETAFTTGKGDERRKGTIKSNYVIDCSGQATLYSKQKQFKYYLDDFRFHSYWAYYEEMNYFSSIDTISPFSERYIKRPDTLQLNLEGWGWAWQILLKDSVSLGIVIPRKDLDSFKAKGVNLEERFRNTIETNEILSQLKSTDNIVDDKIHSIRDYSYFTNHLYSGNVLLAGDSAAFVDPVNSSGVIMAQYAGYLAASVIKKSFEKPEATKKHLQFYEDTLKMRYDLFKAAAIPQKVLSPKMINSCKGAFKMMSQNEVELILNQICLTQRSSNLFDLAKDLGFTTRRKFHEKQYEGEALELTV